MSGRATGQTGSAAGQPDAAGGAEDVAGVGAGGAGIAGQPDVAGGAGAGPATPPVLVLVGPPGAGKTTVGRLLADRLGVAFRDVDHDIEALAGKTVSDIFVDDGEAAFRALETDAVAVALRDHDGVLALGGGAVLDPRTRRRLAGHRVVALGVGLTDAAARVGLGTQRPVLALNPRATLRHLLEARAPLYREVAAVTVATDGRTPAEVADEVLARLAAPVDPSAGSGPLPGAGPA